jgi:hypothetical protein
MRTSAGDGNPLLILSVFNDKGTESSPKNSSDYK